MHALWGPKVLDDQPMCAICQDSFATTPTQTRIHLTCGHIWHEACLNQWLAISYTCPLRCKIKRSYWEHICYATAVGSFAGSAFFTAVAANAGFPVRPVDNFCFYSNHQLTYLNRQVTSVANSSFCSYSSFHTYEATQPYSWGNLAGLCCGGGTLAGFLIGNINFIYDRLMR